MPLPVDLQGKSMAPSVAPRSKGLKAGSGRSNGSRKYLALIAPALLFASQAWGALGAPWQWAVDAIPNQVFDTQQQAESALRALGGKYALAEVIESENMTESTVTYIYGA